MSAALGKAVRVHSARLTGKAFGVLCALALSIGIWWARSAMHPKSPGIALLIALGFSVITIALAASWWFDSTLRLTAYEHGLGWTRGGKTSSVHFDDIDTVREWKINGKPAALIIQRHDGREMRVTSNVSERELLLAHVSANLRDSRVPTATARVRNA